MSIPNLQSQPMIDPKTGNTVTMWLGWFSQLTTVLQNILSDEGLLVPQQPTTNITILDNTKSIGRLVYDSTTNQLKININGTFKVVQVV